MKDTHTVKAAGENKGHLFRSPDEINRFVMCSQIRSSKIRTDTRRPEQNKPIIVAKSLQWCNEGIFDISLFLAKIILYRIEN